MISDTTMKEELPRVIGKCYLGDGVYAGFDGYHIVLTTQHGESRPNNIIYLDPNVIAQLLQYLDNMQPLIQKD
jgi:hypothetical protein